jgi:hypothetical protein
VICWHSGSRLRRLTRRRRKRALGWPARPLAGLRPAQKQIFGPDQMVRSERGRAEPKRSRREGNAQGAASNTDTACQKRSAGIFGCRVSTFFMFTIRTARRRRSAFRRARSRQRSAFSQPPRPKRYSRCHTGSFLSSTRISDSTANSRRSEATRSTGASRLPPGMSSLDTKFSPALNTAPQPAPAHFNGELLRLTYDPLFTTGATAVSAVGSP